MLLRRTVRCGAAADGSTLRLDGFTEPPSRHADGLARSDFRTRARGTAAVRVRTTGARVRARGWSAGRRGGRRSDAVCVRDSKAVDDGAVLRVGRGGWAVLVALATV
nr:DUF397 domain-containing protein [Streptomyces sp. CB09001]